MSCVGDAAVSYKNTKNAHNAISQYPQSANVAKILTRFNCIITVQNNSKMLKQKLKMIILF